MEKDYMEIGKTGLVALEDGRYLNTLTNEILDPEDFEDEDEDGPSS